MNSLETLTIQLMYKREFTADWQMMQSLEKQNEIKRDFNFFSPHYFKEKYETLNWKHLASGLYF